MHTFSVFNVLRQAGDSVDVADFGTAAVVAGRERGARLEAMQLVCGP